MPRLIALSVILLWLAGCAPTNREELVKEVLRADPQFADVLDKHRELTSRIETYQRELALKRSTAERAIEQVRKDLATAASNVRSKTAEIKKRMNPDRERMELALSMASEELRGKRVQRSSLGRSIVKLRKAVKTASAAWTAEERARQEAQIDEMLRDAKRVDQEMTALRAHVRLLKIKLLLIKL